MNQVHVDAQLGGLRRLGWRRDGQFLGRHRSGRNGGTVGHRRAIFGKLLAFIAAQGLVGFPFGFSLVYRDLLHLGEIQAGLRPLLRGELGPVFHAGLHFFLLIGAAIAEIERQGQPFALLGLIDFWPQFLQGRKRGFLAGTERLPGRGRFGLFAWSRGFGGRHGLGDRLGRRGGRCVLRPSGNLHAIKECKEAGAEAGQHVRAGQKTGHSGVAVRGVSSGVLRNLRNPGSV